MSWTPWGYCVAGVAEKMWYSASIECVLPPPKFVCRLITGEAFMSPATRLTASLEQVPQSFGQVGAAEELDRIPVLAASPCR